MFFTLSWIHDTYLFTLLEEKSETTKQNLPRYAEIMSKSGIKCTGVLYY